MRRQRLGRSLLDIWRASRRPHMCIRSHSTQKVCDEMHSIWKERMTPETAQELMTNGYAVLHNVFPGKYTQQLRQEIDALNQEDQMYLNSTHIVTPSSSNTMETTLLEKEHIYEAELGMEDVRKRVPLLGQFFENQLMATPLEEQLPSWLQLHGSSVKLQYNEGNGGCFPMHFDSYGDGSDTKCVTAILYLTDNWTDGDGGELVLYPFPKDEKVLVAPKAGTVALFSSQQMLHRVLPSHKPRYALTTWMYNTPTSDMQQHRIRYYQARPAHSGSSLDQMMAKIVHSSFRRHLAKLVYKDEWKLSLQESHRLNAAFDDYLARHAREMGTIEAATHQMLSTFVEKDSNLPSTPSDLVTALHASQASVRWF